MNKQAEILGLIPARGGSTGLPGKNIRPLHGVPLIGHTILEAKKSKYISRLVVATDSKEIAEVAKDCGAEVPFERPAEISNSTSHAFEVFKYTIDWLKQNENYRPDILCTMLCTTPFRTASDIDDCLYKMIEDDFDWCFTINEIEHHPYRATFRYR
jgi:N-acylneuraminate cytidylyltransferase/CMP-N,N'-diacetyllegionaminic acid synthase